MAEIGQVVNGYEVLGELGKGGMGRVFRVRNVISNRVEAMKILLTDFAPEADLTDRFMGEIHTLAHLEYPNIAKFHTAFKLDNQLVMIMECVEGLTLADQLKQVRIQLPEALSHITQVLSTPTYAHENGVIHRDIKPSNVMITPQEIVKLMDFGIAKSTVDPLTTRSGATIGSIFYISPEQRDHYDCSRERAKSSLSKQRRRPAVCAGYSSQRLFLREQNDNGRLQFPSQRDRNPPSSSQKAIQRLSQSKTVTAEPSAPQLMPAEQPNEPDRQQPQTVAPENGLRRRKWKALMAA